MNKKYADLHTHTSYSDGALTPEALIQLAAKNGLQTLAITDHDTIAGVAEARELGKRYAMDIIPGIELGTHFDGREYHILGYLFDVEHAPLLAYLDSLKIKRVNRAKAIIRQLRARGMELSLAAIEKHANKGVIGRPHIAMAMIDGGLVNSYQEAFDRWIASGKPAFVAKTDDPPQKLMAAIHDAGGVAVLAHPGDYFDFDALHDLILKGLDGIEVVHPSHANGVMEHLREFALKNDLVATGGSDFHTPYRHAHVLGRYVVSIDVIEQLKQRQRLRAGVLS